MTSVSISVKRRCSSVQCIFIPSQMKKQLVVPVMLLTGLGRRGTHHKHTSAFANNTQIQAPGAAILGRGSAAAFSLSSLSRVQFRVCSKWLLPLCPQRKGDFNTTGAEGPDLHFSIWFLWQVGSGHIPRYCSGKSHEWGQEDFTAIVLKEKFRLTTQQPFSVPSLKCWSWKD